MCRKFPFTNRKQHSRVMSNPDVENLVATSPSSNLPIKDRVRFHIFTAADPLNSKNTIPFVKSLQSERTEEVYGFPAEHQPLRLHTELSQNSTIQAVVKSMKHRGKNQRPMITLNDILRRTYFDKEDNPRFGDEYLEEIEVPGKFTTISNPTSEKRQSLQSITKDAVLEHFNGSSPNAKTWIRHLEKECTRLDIPKTRWYEVLRLFLDGIAKDWYQMVWTTIGSSSWEQWESSFNEYFTTKGWSECTYAYNYKFLSGSLSEYMIKKLALLADCDPSLSDNSRCMLVVAGIPQSFHNRLDRSKIQSVGDLISQINQIDQNFLKNKNNNENNPQTSRKNNEKEPNNNNRSRFNPNHKPCRFCERIGKPGRYHPEAECKTKLNPNNNWQISKSATNEKNIKITNNTELEEILNKEVESKN